MKWAVHWAHVERWELCATFWSQKLKGWYNLWNVEVDGRLYCLFLVLCLDSFWYVLVNNYDFKLVFLRAHIRFMCTPAGSRNWPHHWPRDFIMPRKQDVYADMQVKVERKGQWCLWYRKWTYWINGQGVSIAVAGQHCSVNQSNSFIKRSEGKIRECIKASAALLVNISCISP
jgi:hypothetical protein